jgi:hypothetical protein
VSLLNRTQSGRHLDDAALTQIYTEAVASGEPANDPHLSTCAHCRARYAEFTQWLGKIRDDAWAEADEVFPVDRLATQRAHVLRRLEALERPARVIAFPRFGRPVTSTQGSAQRWIAAAAAAGLVIGLAAGQFVDIRHKFGRVGAPAENIVRLNSAPPTLNPAIVVSPTPAPSSPSDETLFLGSDSAQGLVRVSSLQTMDAITPRVRDLDRSR